MDTASLIEVYGELGVIGICMLLFGFMITSLIKENKSQTIHIDEIQQDLSTMKSELNNTMGICVKLIDSVNGFKTNVNDKMDRRHESLMDSLKVSGISFMNYGIHLAEINLILQCIIGVMTIVYLSYKIKNVGVKHDRENNS